MCVNILWRLRSQMVLLQIKEIYCHALSVDFYFKRYFFDIYQDRKFYALLKNERISV